MNLTVYFVLILANITIEAHRYKTRFIDTPGVNNRVTSDSMTSGDGSNSLFNKNYGEILFSNKSAKQQSNQNAEYSNLYTGNEYGIKKSQELNNNTYDGQFSDRSNGSESKDSGEYERISLNFKSKSKFDYINDNEYSLRSMDDVHESRLSDGQNEDMSRINSSIRYGEKASNFGHESQSKDNSRHGSQSESNGIFDQQLNNVGHGNKAMHINGYSQSRSNSGDESQLKHDDIYDKSFISGRRNQSRKEYRNNIDEYESQWKQDDMNGKSFIGGRRNQSGNKFIDNIDAYELQLSGNNRYGSQSENNNMFGQQQSNNLEYETMNVMNNGDQSRSNSAYESQLIQDGMHDEFVNGEYGSQSGKELRNVIDAYGKQFNDGRYESQSSRNYGYGSQFEDSDLFDQQSINGRFGSQIMNIGRSNGKSRNINGYEIQWKKHDISDQSENDAIFDQKSNNVGHENQNINIGGYDGQPRSNSGDEIQWKQSDIYYQSVNGGSGSQNGNQSGDYDGYGTQSKNKSGYKSQSNGSYRYGSQSKSNDMFSKQSNSVGNEIQTMNISDQSKNNIRYESQWKQDEMNDQSFSDEYGSQNGKESRNGIDAYGKQFNGDRYESQLSGINEYGSQSEDNNMFDQQSVNGRFDSQIMNIGDYENQSKDNSRNEYRSQSEDNDMFDQQSINGKFGNQIMDIGGYEIQTKDNSRNDQPINGKLGSEIMNIGGYSDQSRNGDRFEFQTRNNNDRYDRQNNVGSESLSEDSGMNEQSIDNRHSSQIMHVGIHGGHSLLNNMFGVQPTDEIIKYTRQSNNDLYDQQSMSIIGYNDQSRGMGSFEMQSKQYDPYSEQFENDGIESQSKFNSDDDNLLIGNLEESNESGYGEQFRVSEKSNNEYDNQIESPNYKFNYNVNLGEAEGGSSGKWMLEQNVQGFQYTQEQIHPYGAMSNVYFRMKNKKLN